MTVKELKEELNNYPDDWNIVVEEYDGEYDYHSLYSVSPKFRTVKQFLQSIWPFQDKTLDEIQAFFDEKFKNECERKKRFGIELSKFKDEADPCDVKNIYGYDPSKTIIMD